MEALLNFLTLLNSGRKVYFNTHCLELAKKDKISFIIIFDIISERRKKEVENLLKDKKIEVRVVHALKVDLDKFFKKDVMMVGLNDIHAIRKIITLIDGK